MTDKNTVTINEQEFDVAELSINTQAHIARVAQLRNEIMNLQMQINERQVLVDTYGKAIVKDVMPEDEAKEAQEDVMTELRIPSWAVSLGAPLVLAAIPVAIAWGTMQAQAQATNEEVARVATVVEDMEEDVDSNSKSTALNEQAIQAIADSLARSEEIQKASDARLAHLIQIMLEQSK